MSRPSVPLGSRLDAALPAPLPLLLASGAIALLDAHFAALVLRLEGRDDPLLAAAAALTSAAVGLGRSRLDLAAEGQGEEPLCLVPAEAGLPPVTEWPELLSQFSCVGGPDGLAPLVIRGARLFLRRYFAFEQEVFGRLSRMAATRPQPAVPVDLAHGVLRGIFGEEEANGEADMQRFAAFTALRRQLCVVSGGPGTGKTTTVARLLAALLTAAREGQTDGADNAPALRILLAAPTGKAAARLSESMARAVDTLACSEEVRALLPREAATLHRLLGASPGGGIFRHDTNDPLSCDLLVVDEVSMVDLPLMARLLRALPGHARLVLLGDKDQLASVEPGAVLADICAAGDPALCSEAHARDYLGEAGLARGLGASVRIAADAPPLADCMVQLTRSYRFSDTGGIGLLSRLVREGRVEEALDAARQGLDGVVLRDLPRPAALPALLRELALAPYTACCRSTDLDEAFGLLESFRILTPLREGPYGVSALNAHVRALLEADGLAAPGARWFHGLPVMIRKNDHALRLYNGDVGLVFCESRDAPPRVFFPRSGGGYRSLSPLRLPDHEVAYAMTVHKSQGSEFEKILYIEAPAGSNTDNAIIYTAVTRSKSGLIIITNRRIS
ncbi:exodeoxyribonuclease V, alpha subunit [Desulfovibrio sp. X2]|uniref:exodeoxyribonuclease V subunit alpha n=1 Tax=Desulfovibrio sp. X2 TaxID=941449 RepID=UPI000358EF8A|nr:exodeoxyribonuclease V subunit alpha [Desulfovibrio sp. X2]EPR37709.1 exodeoxyribonuclease V, alpha subunit [Desulfovibrio sp. X2]